MNESWLGRPDPQWPVSVDSGGARSLRSAGAVLPDSACRALKGRPGDRASSSSAGSCQHCTSPAGAAAWHAGPSGLGLPRQLLGLAASPCLRRSSNVIVSATAVRSRHRFRSGGAPPGAADPSCDVVCGARSRLRRARQAMEASGLARPRGRWRVGAAVLVGLARPHEERREAELGEPREHLRFTPALQRRQARRDGRVGEHQ